MITATLKKKKGAKLGLKLTSEGDKLFVTKIAEGGAMAKANTALEVGMEVLKINGEDTEGMPSTDAAKIMMDTGGTLTIMARHPQGAFVTGTFNKDSATTKVGLRLEEGEDTVMINSIREGTLASKTDLGGGMAIRLINNTDCVGKDAMFVAQLLADAVGTLTVVAETSESGDLSDRALYSATVEKKEGAKLGLTLTEVDDHLIVTKIKEGGLMAKTDLVEGMEIYSINNIPVMGKSSTDAASILIEANGTLTILAFREEEDSSEESSEGVPPVAVAAAAAVGTTAAVGTGAAIANAVEDEEIEIPVAAEDEEAGEPNEPEPEEKSKSIAPAVAAVAVGTAAVAGAAVANGIKDDAPEAAEEDAAEEPGAEEDPREKSKSAAAAVAAAAAVTAAAAATVAAVAKADKDEAAPEAEEPAEEPEVEAEKSVPVVAVAAAVAGTTASAVAIAKIPRAASVKSSMAPGTLTMAVINKEPGEKLGLRLGQKRELVVVSGLGEGSLASQTDLQPGMVVLYINNQSCVGKDTGDVAKMLGAAGDNIVIIAETPGPTPMSGAIVTASVEKGVDAKVGVTLTQQGTKLLITKIKDEGLLAGTDICVGMEVLSIDNVSCIGKSSSDAAELFRGVEGTLMIICRKPALEAGILVTAALARESPDAKLGIRLGMTNGTVVVTSFADNSLGSKSDLEPGMAIRTINNVDVSGMESSDAAGLLKDAEGIITILAETRKPGTGAGADVSALVAASVLNTKGAILGLSMVPDGRKFVITKIDKDGLFFGTALRVGMEVLKINNVSCTILSKEAQELLMAKEGTLTVLAKRKEIIAGSLMTAVIIKESVDMKVGLGLGVSNGLIVITKIKDGTLGATTDLRPGMAIRTVNNVTCDGMDSMGVAQILSQSEGTITIVAEAQKGTADFAVKAPRYYTATVEKVEGDKVGLALNSRKGGKMFITKIASDGLVADTGLEVGMEVVTINNIDCAGKTTIVAAELLQTAEGTLTILVKKPPRGPGSLVTASVTKETVNSKVGLKLGLSNGVVVVAGLGENSLASKTELEPGMVIKSIDNVDVAGMDVASAARLLMEGEGILTILAETPKGRAGGAGAAVISSLVTATALTGEGESHGVTMERKNGKLLVSKIEETGALFGTGLRLGMQVIAINNIDCSLLSESAGNDLLTKEGTLTMLAKPVSLPPGTLMTSAFFKETADTKVGLRLGMSNGVIVVTKVADGTLSATTNMEAGMVIRAINNIDCTKRSSEMAAKLLMESVGTVIILSEKPTNKGADLTLPISCIFAITFKKDKEGKLGVTLNNNGGKLSVGSIAPESLLANTRLRVGMEIMKINNVDCAGTSPSEAAKWLSDTEGAITVLAKRASSAPGTIITATINKESSDAKVGIGLGALGAATVITNIKDNTLAMSTDLEVGMIVRSINNVDCGDIDASEAARLLAGEGKITIIGEMPSTSRLPSLDSLVTATVEKGPEDKLGLTVAQKGEKIFVSKIKPDSLIDGLGLAVGMELLSIDNDPCVGKSSADIAKTLSEAKGTLTLLARKAALPPGSFVTAVIVKENPESKIGLRLGAAGGFVVVSSLAEDSLASATDLAPGMIIRTINNVDCQGMLPPDAVKLLIEAEGPISILAETPKARGVAADAPMLANFVTVSVNSAAGDDIGLNIAREQRKLVVSEISEDGLIMGSQLRVGMEIVKINNVDCGVLTAAAATELMKTEGALTILARKPVLPPGTLVTAVIRKASTDTKVGMKMGMVGNTIVISGVSDGSLASTTPLERGMVVKSINNINVTKKDASTAAGLLSKSVGLITVLAEVPSKTTESTALPTLVTVSVDKAADDETGVTFTKDKESFLVASLVQDGIWAKTRLRVGMEVLMINGSTYEDASAEEIEGALKSVDGRVTILAKTETLAPGTLVTAAMVKESSDDKVGLGIGSIGDKVIITNIKNDSLASPTDLQNGMVMRLVNNVDCTEMDSAQVGRMLGDSEGPLTVVAQVPTIDKSQLDFSIPVTTTVFKEKGATTGMTLLDKSGIVYISKIKDDGLIAGTGIRVGMEVISINNKQCAGMKAAVCAQFLAETFGDITILVRSPVLLPGSFITAIVTKESTDTKVGLKLGDANGKVVVTGLAENSLAEDTELELGMTIRMINNVDCTGLAVADAAKLLVEGQGTLTILASTPLDSSFSPDDTSMSTICAVSFEQPGDSNLGITVVRKGGYPVVSEIVEKGLVFGSALRVGMEILKINNVDCSILSADSATLLMNKEGPVTLLARKKELPAGFLITGVIIKDSPEVKVGLGMGSKNGLLYVTKIRDGTIGALTELQPGMIVRTIDNVDLTGVTLIDAANILANAEGTITVAAEMPGAEVVESKFCTATVQKASEDKAGLAIVGKGGAFYISQIAEDSLLASTVLQVGMEVMAINNVQCKELSLEDAASMLRDSDGNLTILARKAILLPGSLVTANITKENVDSKIGLRVGVEGGVIVVKGINEGSLASRTELKPGMIVKSIDNVSTQGKDAVASAKLLTGAVGTVTIVAETPGEASMPASALVTVTLRKEKGASTGLTVGKKSGKTAVTRIAEDGLLFGSVLRVGMEVLKINNVDSRVLTSTSAMKLMDSKEMVTILARKTLKRAGVLVAATFKKPTAATKAGLGLGAKKGVVVVTKVANGTPASTTQMQSGMVIRQINGIPCDNLGPTEIAQELAGAEGLVSLLLETPGATGNMGSASLNKSLATAAVDKDEGGDLGVTFRSKNGHLFVSNVSENGLFANSGLRPGMAMLSINNSNCAKKVPEDALEILEAATGVVTILTQKPFLGPGEIVTATIRRDDPSTSIGLGLGTSSKTGKVVITSIKPGTPAFYTPLYAGMAVQSINNQSLKRMTPDQAAKILSEATGTISIAAESMLLFDVSKMRSKAGTIAATITATAVKEKGGKVGLLLGEKGKKLFVSKIVPGGLMSATALKVGMQVLCINNVDCTNMPVSEAASILMEAEGTITILAKQPELAPGALITVSVDKAEDDTPLGIGLGVLNDKIVISSIKFGSPTASSDLQVGMAIKAVNNVDCSRKTPEDVAKLFSKAGAGSVMILGEAPYPPGRMTGGDASSAGRMVFDNEARPPPYGVAEGGVWVTKKFIGQTTTLFTAIGCACFIVPGVYSILNPVDVRDIYVYGGDAYTADGIIVGAATKEES